MSRHRVLLVLPVLVGLVVTGSAIAQMSPRSSVRDSVYQTCAHNGVHFNKQGHPNCGLHLGWSTGGELGSHHGPGGAPGTPGEGLAGDAATGHGHNGHATHGDAKHGDAKHGAVEHGNAGHGHGGGHGWGKGHTHGGSSHAHHGNG